MWYVLGILLGLGIWFADTSFNIWLKMKLYAPRTRDAKGRKAVNYFIRFKDGVAIPDLRQEPTFKEVGSIKFEKVDGYCIASTLSDAKLKEFFETTYQLKPGQYTISTGQFIM